MRHLGDRSSQLPLESSHLALIRDTSHLTLVPARLTLGTTHLNLVSAHLALVTRDVALEDVPPHHLTLVDLVPEGGAGINPTPSVWHHGVLEGRVGG